MKPSDWPLQARRRTCSLSIWRHDTIRHGGHDGHGHGMPRSALKAESRSCRAQAFRNAQFEPLPEPSRKERCCHVLKHVTCLNMSYLVSQSAEETCFSSLWKSPPYKMIQNVHKIQLIQQSLLRTDYCSLSLSIIHRSLIALLWSSLLDFEKQEYKRAMYFFMAGSCMRTTRSKEWGVD
jgi:hypothetical protein